MSRLDVKAFHSFPRRYEFGGQTRHHLIWLLVLTAYAHGRYLISQEIKEYSLRRVWGLTTAAALQHRAKWPDWQEKLGSSWHCRRNLQVEGAVNTQEELGSGTGIIAASVVKWVMKGNILFVHEMKPACWLTSFPKPGTAGNLSSFHSVLEHQCKSKGRHYCLLLTKQQSGIWVVTSLLQLFCEQLWLPLKSLAAFSELRRHWFPQRR